MFSQYIIYICIFFKKIQYVWMFFNGFKINQDIAGISSLSLVLTAFEALVQIWYKGTRNFCHLPDLKP